MEFLKSLVPTVISGDSGGSVESGGLLPRDTGPRLLRVKRLSLLSMGPTIEEDPEGSVQANRLSRLIRHRAKGIEDLLPAVAFPL
ncbi:hypothetical protein Baya_9439 [Bagarius yarrelli]|uniref:Uncharacterized protein n=1 Tax=Bagarius yarrelli TaxID=175774 RepID=A0A556U6P0_BAGYA|nr:hypothetical protein Baya_9439 [Bagarius yarrelli]